MPAIGCRSAIGLFFIPTTMALLQSWASFRIIQQIKPEPLFDGTAYVVQARAFQDVVRDEVWQHFPEFWGHLTAYGLYPLFLSTFDLSLISDWSTSSVHPQIMTVYAVQTLLLAQTTAVFLFAVYRLLPGDELSRILSSIVLGGLLLSPLVVDWPSSVLAETLTLSAMLIFVLACLAYDRRERYGLALIGLSCVLVVFTRDPMIFYVWIFAALLGCNVLVAREPRRASILVGLALLIAAATFGYTRATVSIDKGKFLQNIVNVIQIRILPDPARKKFFVDRGLPISPTVLERVGHPAWVDNAVFEPDSAVTPDFLAFRIWVAANGNRTYLAFLATHPWYFIKSVFVSPNDGPYGGDFHFSVTDAFSTPFLGYGGLNAPYPPSLTRFMLAPVGWCTAFLYLAFAALRFAAATFARRRASAIEIAALAAGTAIFVSYQSDAWDFWRHVAPFVLLIYISMILRAPEMARDLVNAVATVVAHLRKSSNQANAAPVDARDQRRGS
jgi:hypothetical protein